MDEILINLTKSIEEIRDRNLEENNLLLAIIATLTNENNKNKEDLNNKINQIKDLEEKFLEITQRKEKEQIEYENKINLLSQQNNELEFQLNQQRNNENNLKNILKNNELENERKEKEIKEINESYNNYKIKTNEKMKNLISLNEEYVLQLKQSQELKENLILLKDRNQILQQENNEKDLKLERNQQTIDNLTKEMLVYKNESIKYLNDYDIETKRVAQLTRALAASRMLPADNINEDPSQSNHNTTTTGSSGGSTGNNSEGQRGVKKFNLSTISDKMTHLVKTGHLNESGQQQAQPLPSSSSSSTTTTTASSTSSQTQSQQQFTNNKHK